MPDAFSALPHGQRQMKALLLFPLTLLLAATAEVKGVKAPAHRAGRDRTVTL